MAAGSGASILTYPALEQAVPQDFVNEERSVALLVHGWTGSAERMATLASYLHRTGQVHCLLANYNSLDGVEHASRAILQLIEAAASQLTDARKFPHRLSLVGHSFGGLVGSFMVKQLNGERFFKTLITLGTPHGGVVNDNEVVAFLFRIVQKYGNVMKFPPSLGGKTVNELIGRDEPELLSALKAVPFTEFPACSISGGKCRYPFHDDKKINETFNATVQRALGERPNDGIVVESSADLREGSPLQSPDLKHVNNYEDFANVCHMDIVENQRVLSEVHRILADPK